MNKMKKVSYNAPVTLTFALIALLVLALGNVTNDQSTMTLFSVYRGSPLDPLFYLRLFGHVLGHANLEHYVNNMLLILLLGPLLEEKYGQKLLLIMILATALITGVVFICFSGKALLGASGIVFMMITLSSVANVRKGTIPLTLIVVMVLYLGREVINAVQVQDHVSQLTHIVGGVLGCVYGTVINKQNNHL